MSRGRGADDAQEGVMVLVQLAGLLLLGVIVLGVVISGTTASATNQRVDATGDTASIDNWAVNPTLVDSTGQAVAHGSGQSNVELPSDGGVGDGNTTVTVWAELDGNANLNDSFHVANLADGVVSVQFRNGSWFAHVNKTGGGVAEATAPASSPAQSLTMVGVRTNGTHLDLVVDGTVRNTTTFDATSNASVPSARSWWGTVDDLRVWASPIDDAALSSVADDPNGPAAQGDLNLRAPLDEGSGAQTYAVLVGSYGDLTGATSWTSGLEGNSLVEGRDYSYSGGGVVEISGGSRLDALNIAWASYENQAASMVPNLSSALELAAILPIALVAVLIVRRLGGLNSDQRR